MTPRLNFPGGTLFNWVKRSEGRGKRSEVGKGRRAEDGRQRTDVRRQKSEIIRCIWKQNESGLRRI